MLHQKKKKKRSEYSGLYKKNLILAQKKQDQEEFACSLSLSLSLSHNTQRGALEAE
jgi:hypothetical protein